VTYSVLVHPKAAKELQSLECQTRARNVERAKELRDKPEAGKPLTQSDFWSLRVGDYRAIYQIDREKNKS
jgi:mRNA-degrading endonuclease RelE of RelBE toxin-antitoxin system